MAEGGKSSSSSLGLEVDSSQELDDGSHQPNVQLLEAYGYKLESQLGRGTYGKVFKASRSDSEKDVAVKVIEMAKVSQTYRRDYLPTELEVMRDFKHPNIVSMIEMFEEVDKSSKLIVRTYIVMEVAKCDLEEVWRNCKSQFFPEAELQKIYKGVIAGMRFLHAHHAAHRDLKPGNILIALNDGRGMVADFGMAKILEDANQRTKSMAGTWSYMCPQMIEGKGVGEYNPFKADVWSLGVMLYKVLTNQHPYDLIPGNFAEQRSACQMGEFNANNMNEDFGNGNQIFSPQVISLLRGMLTFNEAQRFTINQVARHEWIDDLQVFQCNTCNIL